MVNGSVYKGLVVAAENGAMVHTSNYLNFVLFMKKLQKTMEKDGYELRTSVR